MKSKSTVVWLLSAALFVEGLAFQAGMDMYKLCHHAFVGKPTSRSMPTSVKIPSSLLEVLPGHHHYSEHDGSSNHSKDPSSTQLSASASFALPRSQQNFRIFCDLDGVLCDFDRGVRALSRGISADSLPDHEKWRLIGRADRFYERLPWTSDGRRLWNAIKPLKPDILTGVSMAPSCPREKAKWCARELGVATNHVDKACRSPRGRHQEVTGRAMDDVVNVITCWSRNKHFESGHKAVLIDDRIALADDWIKKGGIFVHHTDTESTLEQLQCHGILTHVEDSTPVEETNDLLALERNLTLVC